MDIKTSVENKKGKELISNVEVLSVRKGSQLENNLRKKGMLEGIIARRNESMKKINRGNSEMEIIDLNPVFDKIISEQKDKEVLESSTTIALRKTNELLKRFIEEGRERQKQREEQMRAIDEESQKEQLRKQKANFQKSIYDLYFHICDNKMKEHRNLYDMMDMDKLEKRQEDVENLLSVAFNDKETKPIKELNNYAFTNKVIDMLLVMGMGLNLVTKETIDDQVIYTYNKEKAKSNKTMIKK